jgi:FAD dependent oxidoreductase
MATISDFDVIIAGGSFGGCAAALAAAADKKVKVVLLESGAWVGGQATSQGLTRWDETAAELTEATGSPRSYRQLRDLIREHYADVRSELGQQQEYFNPGFAGVGPPFTTMTDPPLFRGDQRRGHPFAADPKVVLEILTKLLNDAGVTVKTGVTVTGADVRGRVVRSLTVRTASGTDTYTGKVFLDATDLGDLLPMCKVPFVIGAEAKSDTQEDGAEAIAHPEFIQPFTVPIAVRWVDPDPNNRIPKPANYDDIRRRQGFDRIKVPNKNGTVGDGDIREVFNPEMEGDTLINYRQFIDPRNFDDGRPWRTTLNVGGNDYLTRAIPTNPHSAAADAVIVEEARAVSIAYVFYLQNDVPRDHGPGTGYLNVKIDTETFDRADGTAPARTSASPGG